MGELHGNATYFYICVVYMGIVHYILRLTEVSERVASNFSKQAGYEPGWSHYYQIVNSIKISQYQIAARAQQSIWYIHDHKQKDAFEKLMNLVLKHGILDEVN